MKIRFYGYNAFIIESGDKKLAIDPGALFLYYFRLTSLIPESEWKHVTHIFVTHGDPDHHWHTDRIAEASAAPVICNRTMVKQVNGRTCMLGPRAKGLGFTASIKNVHPISVDEEIELDGMSIMGLKATHGPLLLKVGPFAKQVQPGPMERVGWGAMGFRIRLDGRTIVIIGDSLLHTKEWSTIKNPDVLMIPIGGRTSHNTMDEDEALSAVEMMRPSMVIPCHYNFPALFSKNYCPADDRMFKREVEKLGIECEILQFGQSIGL